MKKLLVLIVLVAVLFLPLASQANYNSCDRAAWAGWHHPGLNNACFMEIMADIIGGGGWEDR